MHKAELNRSNRKHNVTVRSVSRTLCLILHPLYKGGKTKCDK